MRFSVLLSCTLAATAQASTWFGKAAYNSWHETELERWLSDNNVPYPTPADRKDLETLVKDNWNANSIEPYNSWDTKQLQSYLTSKGKQASKGTENNKNKLVEQVKSSWTETADTADTAYGSVRDWILDSWTDSQLKSFLDYNNIPNPSPRNRDSLLTTARSNYNAIAKKAGETAAYPGDWLYSSWSESDLKAWCDERGIPVPQTSSRDKIIASVRRNSRIASGNMAQYKSSASSAAAEATNSVSSAAAAASSYLSDALLDSWSDSQIKEWADKNDIKVPQGSKRNELIALARKHRAKLTGDNVSYQAGSAYGAATSSAGNQFAYATSAAYNYYTWLQHQLGLAASTASASAVSATSVAGKSGSSAYSTGSSVVGKSASSVSSVGSKSASSASSLASKSAYSASSVASKSAASVIASISSEASSASSSAAKVYSTKGSKQAQKAGNAAAESVSKAKHRVLEAAQKATNYAKEEL